MEEANNNTNTKSSRKRKKSSTTTSTVNPLSHARGSSKSHENVWFRKTGAGYQLFVQYYAGQPLGTVAAAGLKDKNALTLNTEATKSGDTTTTTTTTTSKTTTSGAGHSRAAKRRKKKQQKMSSNDTNENDNNDNKTPNGENQVTDNNHQQLQSQQSHEDNSTSDLDRHPLLACLTKLSNKDNKSHCKFLRPFLQAMSKPLPVTFRLRRSLNASQLCELKSQIQQDFSTLVKPLPFGNDLIFQASCSKPTLQQFPALKQFLVQHSQNGSLARQELGSMLPLLALEHVGCFSRHKKMRVLDLCASPGSKTLQALELLLLMMVENDDNNIKTPKILANDVSPSRLEALRDAVQRSGLLRATNDSNNNSNQPKIGYSCQDARHFTTPTATTTTDTNNQNQNPKQKWDVIVCDVPCSGDGTIRKADAHHIVESWKPQQGHVLHGTQLQILLRALQLVKVGGTICYSTCSLNPVENEAVVAAALAQHNRHCVDKTMTHRQQALSPHHNRDHDGNTTTSSTTKSQTPAVELIEFPTIPGLELRPGITTWSVADYPGDDVDGMNNNNNTNNGAGRNTHGSGKKDSNEHSNNVHDTATTTNDDDDDDETPQLVWYDTYQSACKANMQHAVSTMWPPASSSSSNSNKKDSDNNNGMDDIKLERCARLWPQDHDSGGFFLALIRKNR